MGQTVTLLCPEGAFDYPISCGEEEFYPYRLDHTSQGREFGGPWAVTIPIEKYHHFVGRAGFVVMEQEPEQIGEHEIAPKLLRKRDGSYAGCSWRGQSFEPDDHGVVMVPHMAVGELVESHGFELVPDDGPSADEAVSQTDAALDKVDEGIAADQERIETLRDDALAEAHAPEGAVEEVRAEVEGESHEDDAAKAWAGKQAEAPAKTRTAEAAESGEETKEASSSRRVPRR